MQRNTIALANESEQLEATVRRHQKAAAQLASTTQATRSSRNDILPTLAIVQCAVDQLKLRARRLRKSDPTHVREIANAISTLGFNLPLLVGRNNEIVDGNSRLEAARLLRLTHVPCIRLDHLDANDQRLVRLAVNRLAEKGMWDFTELKAEFEELIIDSAPVEITGFGIDAIDQIIIGGKGWVDEVSSLEPKTGSSPVSRLGDTWLLGDHRLVCGDAMDPNVLVSLMRSDVARMVFTNALFKTAISDQVTDNKRHDFFIRSGEMSNKSLRLNCRWLDAVLPHVVDGGLVGIFVDWKGLPIVHAGAESLGLEQIDLIVCAKTNQGTPNLYLSQHELLPLFKKGNAPHVDNVAVGKRRRRRSDVWTYPGASSLGSDAKGKLKEHPAVKPAAIIEHALVDLSNRAEVILEPFSGSGSTLIACEKAGRLCRAIELNPVLVDVAIRRFQDLTNNKVILEATGGTFDDVEREGRSAGPQHDQGNHAPSR